jgi:hypothetical protein
MSIIPIRLRDREILDAQLVRCRQIDNSFTQGAAAGLRWLTAGGPGPLTGTLATLIDFRSVVHEHAPERHPPAGRPACRRSWGGTWRRRSPRRRSARGAPPPVGPDRWEGCWTPRCSAVVPISSRSGTR